MKLGINQVETTLNETHQRAPLPTSSFMHTLKNTTTFDALARAFTAASVLAEHEANIKSTIQTSVIRKMSDLLHQMISAQILTLRAGLTAGASKAQRIGEIKNQAIYKNIAWAINNQLGQNVVSGPLEPGAQSYAQTLQEQLRNALQEEVDTTANP